MTPIKPQNFRPRYLAKLALTSTYSGPTQQHLFYILPCVAENCSFGVDFVLKTDYDVLHADPKDRE
jgi:hypothetical protein